SWWHLRKLYKKAHIRLECYCFRRSQKGDARNRYRLSVNRPTRASDRSSYTELDPEFEVLQDRRERPSLSALQEKRLIALRGQWFRFDCAFRTREWSLPSVIRS